MKIILFLLVMVMVSVIPFTFAQEYSDSVITITAIADQDSNRITVTGKTISDLTDVTFRVTSPSGNTIVAESQVSPDSNGDFIEIFEITSIWKEDGFYTITVKQSVVHNSLYSLKVQVEINNGLTEQTSVTESNLSTETMDTIEETVEENSVSAITISNSLSYSTSNPIVMAGNQIIITGNIEPYDSFSGLGLTYVMVSPINDVIELGEITPNPDGTFVKTIVADGLLWKLIGDYMIEFKYGTDSSKAIFNYIGTGQPIPEPTTQPVIIIEPKPIFEETVEENSVSVITATSSMFSDSYGDTIVISGNITPYDYFSGLELSYVMVSPINDVVDLGEIIINSDGTFEKYFATSAPLWEISGDYKIEFNYGADSYKMVISYIGTEQQPRPAAEPRPMFEETAEIIPESTSCTLQWEPVCGIDGETYGNQCVLDAANISLDYVGECIVDSTPEIIPELTPKQIPEWVRGIVIYWAEGKISDSEFFAVIKFLIDAQIMVL